MRPAMVGRYHGKLAPPVIASPGDTCTKQARRTRTNGAALAAPSLKSPKVNIRVEPFEMEL